MVLATASAPSLAQPEGRLCIPIGQCNDFCRLQHSEVSGHMLVFGSFFIDTIAVSYLSAGIEDDRFSYQCDRSPVGAIGISVYTACCHKYVTRAVLDT